MATTLADFTAVQIAMPLWIRPHLGEARDLRSQRRRQHGVLRCQGPPRQQGPSDSCCRLLGAARVYRECGGIALRFRVVTCITWWRVRKAAGGFSHHSASHESHRPRMGCTHEQRIPERFSSPRSGMCMRL
jgi:hypothetical protein